MLVTNHKPHVRGNDDGIWRRLRLVPFAQRFWDPTRGESGPPELQADRGLKAALEAERSSILRWLVDGCLEWQRVGLGEPAQVHSATAQYRATEDVLAAFFADSCVVGPLQRVRAIDLYASYQRWCDANGETAMNSRDFGLAMTARGFERYTSNGTCYRGIGLNNLGDAAFARNGRNGRNGT